MGGYARLKSIDGFKTAGDNVPFVNAHDVVIVGRDVPATPENWWAHCPRLEDVTDESLEKFVQDILDGAKTDPVDGVKDGSKVIILDGRRTTLATRIAYARQAERKVPVEQRAAIRVVLHKGTEEDFFRINKDSHNALPLTPMQEAKQVLHYYEHVGQDVKKTAAMFGVTEANVNQKLRLFELHPSVQKAVDAKVLPFSQAIKLADLPRDDQKKALADMQEAGATKGEAATNAINKARRGEKIEAKDKSRMRSKMLIENFRDLLKKAGYNELVGWLSFVLGGPIPKDTSTFLREQLAKAGLKEAMPKVEKPAKEPKDPKEKKAKTKKGKKDA